MELKSSQRLLSHQITLLLKGTKQSFISILLLDPHNNVNKDLRKFAEELLKHGKVSMSIEYDYSKKPIWEDCFPKSRTVLFKLDIE